MTTTMSLLVPPGVPGNYGAGCWGQFGITPEPGYFLAISWFGYAPNCFPIPGGSFAGFGAGPGLGPGQWDALLKDSFNDEPGRMGE